MTNPSSIVHCTVSHMYINTCMYIYYVEFLLLTLLTWFTLAPTESSSLTMSVRPRLAATMSAVTPFCKDRVSVNRV